MRKQFWLCNTLIVGWVLFWAPEVTTTFSWMLWALGVVGGIAIAQFTYGRYSTPESLPATAVCLCAFALILSSAPIEMLPKRYVGLYLGEKRSQVYAIGSESSKRIEPDREDDGFRKLRYFAFWQTAKISGFKPCEEDIPEAKRISLVAVLIGAIFEWISSILPALVISSLFMALLLWLFPRLFRLS